MGERGKKLYKYRYFYIMFVPVFLGLFVFHYLPMVGVLYSFTEYTPFSVPTFIGMENFKTLFQSRAFWRAFGNTVEISFLNLILNLVCSVGLALLIDEIASRKFRMVTQTIVYIPHFISWVVVASIFTMFLSPKNGMINKLIEMAGGEAVYFLANEKWWRPVFYFISRWKETGWGTIIFIAALMGIDQEMYEAAKIDGANGWKTFWKITVPLLKPTIIMTFIMSINGTLQLFDESVNLTKGGPANSTITMSHYVYNTCFINVPNFGYASAMSFLIFIMVAVLAFINLKVGDTRD